MRLGLTGPNRCLASRRREGGSRRPDPVAFAGRNACAAATAEGAAGLMLAAYIILAVPSHTLAVSASAKWMFFGGGGCSAAPLIPAVLRPEGGRLTGKIQPIESVRS